MGSPGPVSRHPRCGDDIDISPDVGYACNESATCAIFAVNGVLVSNDTIFNYRHK